MELPAHTPLTSLTKLPRPAAAMVGNTQRYADCHINVVSARIIIALSTKPKPINGMADAINTLFSCALVGTELVRRFRVAAAAAALAKQCWEPPFQTTFKLWQEFRGRRPGKPYLLRRKAWIMAETANALPITGWDGTPRKDSQAARHPHLQNHTHLHHSDTTTPTTTTIKTSFSLFCCIMIALIIMDNTKSTLLLSYNYLYSILLNNG